LAGLALKLVSVLMTLTILSTSVFDVS
jgi:hypothetical protein